MSALRISILLLLVLPAVVAGQELANLSPQAGLLVLRNGQLLRGEITRAGDNYTVTFGVGGEVKIAATEVETQCADLEAAYDWKQRRLSGDGAGPHLDLAEWCLRHNLHRRCAEQLSRALATEPEHRRIDQIDRRLQLALQAPAAPAPKPVNSTIVGAEQLEKTLRALPKGSLERFTTIVQPMLNNRCATSHCHGATSTSEFRLLRPPAGLNSPQRFTQRNLYAALQFVDRDDPANSRLLTIPQEPHGGGTTAAFDARTKAQLQDLQTWIDQLAHRKEQPVPATIDPKATQLSTPLRATPGGTTNVGGKETPSPSDAPHTGALPIAPISQSPGKLVDPKHWQPRDAFDPEIFNRRHAKK